MQLVVDDVRLLDHMSLAKSTSGKIARRKNLEWYVAEFAGQRIMPRYNDESVSNRVAHIVANHTRGQDNIISSGEVDSMALVRLILDLEEAFGVIVPAEAQLALDHFDSVSGISTLIHGLIESSESDLTGVRSISSCESVRDRKCADFLAGPKEYDLLILGSSRVQSVSAKLAETYGYSAYNFSVFSARAEDWYCIYKFVTTHNRLPLKKIILGIDIEAFTVGTGLDERLTSSSYLSAFLDESDQAYASGSEAPPDVKPAQRNRFDQLMRQLRQQAADRERAHGYDSKSGDLVYLDDDPVCRKHNRRQPLQLNDPTDYNLEYQMRLAGFDRLNPKRLSYFLRLVQSCLERGTEVTSFFTPLHPALHQHLCTHTDYMLRMRELVDGLRGNQTPLFTLSDFSTPAQFGGLDEDFINAAHIGAANADLLLHRLLAGTASKAKSA